MTDYHTTRDCVLKISKLTMIECQIEFGNLFTFIHFNPFNNRINSKEITKVLESCTGYDD